jgi:hypothetical protein
MVDLYKGFAYKFFREGLEALAQNASVTDEEYLSDGTVQIALTMNLIGGFAQFYCRFIEKYMKGEAIGRLPIGCKSASSSAGEEPI